jgi:hypothetical protein
MKIISFNTYLAPTMPNRFFRKNGIIKKINNWMHQGIDVISLQEMNDFKIGLFGYIYYNYMLYNYCNIFFQRFFDLLYIFEGILFPLYLYDNSVELKIEVDKFNLSTNNKYYFIKSEEKKRSFSGGLVILSLHKPILNKTFYLKTDCVHCPSILYTKFINLKQNIIFNILNLHLIPSLENHNIFYKIVNFLNNINIYNLQKNNIENLINFISKNIYMSENIKQNIFISGDFNIKKNKQKELYDYLVKNIYPIGIQDNTLSNSTNFTCTEHFLGMKDGENGCEVDQIDYIFSNIKSVNFKRMFDCFYLSDHYPIIVHFN